MLVPTVALSPQNRRFASDLPFGYSVGEFSWFRFWDAIVPSLGRVSLGDYPFGATSRAKYSNRMLRKSGFGEYWRERLQEALVKARVMVETALFILFLCGGLVLLFKPNFPIDRSIWWFGFGAFVLVFLVELCFVSPYQHEQKIAEEYETALDQVHRERGAAIQELEAERSRKPIPIEVVDDLIVEAEETAALLSGFEHKGSDHIERPFIKKAREQLRLHAPDYVTWFNEMVSSPYTHDHIPRIGRTMNEHGEWASDQERAQEWRLISACIIRLKEIRIKIRSKLPS
jgi:hypothetical protein